MIAIFIYMAAKSNRKSLPTIKGWRNGIQQSTNLKRGEKEIKWNKLMEM